MWGKLLDSVLPINEKSNTSLGADYSIRVRAISLESTRSISSMLLAKVGLLDSLIIHARYD